jgi:hypothetical protein
MSRSARADAPVIQNNTATPGGESIVCFAGEDWWYHNPHSNKHLMQELARFGNRVLFVNSTGIRTPRLFRDRYAWKRIVRKLRRFTIFRWPYEALPAYLRCFRCCAIFYRAGITFNDYRSPKKLLEYFATGLPLVSTRLAELDGFPHLVYQASTAEEFHHQLQRALSESDPDLRRQRIEAARSRDWQVVAAEAFQHILRHLELNESRARSATKAKAASSA